VVEEFSERLRRVREAKGVTPYRLAQITGLSKQGVLNLEEEGADPKLSTVVKLAKALGIHPCDLLADRPATTPVDQAPATTPVDQGADGTDGLPPWVHTDKDEETDMRVTWSFIQDARDVAEQGYAEEAAEDLEHLLGSDGSWPPISVSYYWHAFWARVETRLEWAVGDLRDVIAPRVARYGKMTDASHKQVKYLFDGLDACFIHLADEWVGDWQEQRDEEQAEEEERRHADARARPADEDDEDDEDDEGPQAARRPRK
jgi:transcriptional regulator with XRE-family HTH domain